MPPPEFSLALRPEQRMLLLPKMLQALDVLQLPRIALDEMLTAALADNEALRLRPEDSGLDEGSDVAPWTERRRSRRADRGRRESRRIEEIPDHAPTLKDHLYVQLAGIDAPPRTLELLRFVVESLDGNGLRTLDDREWSLAVDPPATPRELQNAEAQLVKIEPRGWGSRTTVDAMLCQVNDLDPDKPAIRSILLTHLEDLARHRKGTVASALALPLEELDLLLTKIGALSPRPSSGFADGVTQVIRPEVRVRRQGISLEIVHVEARHFAVELDPVVTAMSKDRSTPPEMRGHLRERIDSAKELLQCLDQRRQTLERVTHALFLRQVAFLDRGPKHLRPLRMHDLAAALDIHPSTISRAVSGKYVETDWGIYRLRDFFEVAVATTSGEGATRAGLRDALRSCIEAEDRARPLDDDALATLLKQKGFVVARRTVAKYRVELGIPSSWHRGRATEPVAVAAPMA